MLSIFRSEALFGHPVLADEVQNKEHLRLLNAIAEDEMNENVSDNKYAFDIEDNEDTQSKQSFVLDDNIDDKDEQQPLPPA